MHAFRLDMRKMCAFQLEMHTFHFNEMSDRKTLTVTGCIWKLNFNDVHELRVKSFQVVTFARKLCDITGNMDANETILVELLILLIQITLFGH